MSNWSFRQDAVTEIEDERPRGKILQNIIDGAIERRAAHEQHQRIEIALHGDLVLDMPAHKCRLGSPVDAYGVHRRRAYILCKRSTRAACGPGVPRPAPM